MTVAIMGMAIVRAMAVGSVMTVGVAIALATTMALVLVLVLVPVLVPVREIALEIASAALTMVRATRLLVPQSAASRRSWWIVSEVLELEYALIPAPTSRRLYLH